MFHYEAHALYSEARSKGRRGRAWSVLTGRSRRLFTLAEIKAACTVRARHYAGLRTVPIAQIRGSEDRSSDFDRDFNPLQGKSKWRWLSVATAWQKGKELAPVDLVQVGDVYFVRDGHHRVSVARALGQREIEAEVAVWQVGGALPWEKGAGRRGARAQVAPQVA